MKKAEDVIITLLQMKEMMETPLNVGDFVEFKAEPSNKFDANAIMVFLNGNQIGYVANNQETTVIEGTHSASEISSNVPVKGKILTENSSNSYMRRYVVGFLEYEQNETPNESNEIKFSLVGGVSTFPAKINLLKDIETGEQNIIIKKEDANLIGFYNNEPVGRVKAEDSILRRLSEFIEDAKKVEALAIEKSKGNLLCSLKIKNAPKPKSKNDLEKTIKDILKNGIDTKGNLDEKLKYLLGNGVSKENISDIFLTYIEYSDADKARMKKPKTLYIDSSGIVNDSIIYILEGNNLIYEGDKGVGKNVLTETIAWIFGRPLYEFSSNSQHSNNSLMGGETFKRPEKNEESEKTLLGFFKKVTGKFMGKADDNELDALSSFIRNSFGKDDKELVFQMSSILEAFVNGGIIVLDEFNTSQAHVMPLFNALLDERRRLEVTGLGKVNAHKNFIAIGTQNKGYQGTFDSNEATLDRFEPLIFPPLESISKLLEMKNPDIGYETIDICNKLYLGIKKSVENGNLGEDAVSTRGFISASKAITRGMDIKRALINSVANRASDLEDREAIKNMIDLQIANK